MTLPTIDEQCSLLNDNLCQQIDFRCTDHCCGIAASLVQRPPRVGQSLILLPVAGSRSPFAGIDLLDAIGNRERHRTFLATGFSLEEVGLLLWATQGHDFSSLS